MTDHWNGPIQRLEDCPQRQAGISWPTPIHRRLDDLILLLRREAARRTTRKELTAALILSAPPDPEVLDTWIRSYRLAEVGDARLGRDWT